MASLEILKESVADVMITFWGDLDLFSAKKGVFS
jgi:hypothetical protein